MVFLIRTDFIVDQYRLTILKMDGFASLACRRYEAGQKSRIILLKGAPHRTVVPAGHDGRWLVHIRIWDQRRHRDERLILRDARFMAGSNQQLRQLGRIALVRTYPGPSRPLPIAIHSRHYVFTNGAIPAERWDHERLTKGNILHF
ncbi:hypothetical protein DM806_01670 [Sphingobium lactosutens]|nr:hypothetical protein [Sphingobium lactosutens]